MSKIQQRFYYMDAMRAVLMTLGIVLHSANVFTDSPWAIQNIQTSGAFTYIVAFLHSFRMPAFFIVSGFFCHMTLKKYGYKMFLNVRIPRVIIPLVATALLLNSVQNLVLYYYYSSDIYLLSAQYWLQGKWLSHLWFLNCLVYYFLISALMYRYLPVPLEKVSHLLSNIILKSKGIYILILPIVSLILIKLSYLIPDLPSNLYTGSIAETIKYSGFFIFGTLIGINRSLLQEIISIRILILISILFIYLAYFYAPNLNTDHSKIFMFYIESLTAWLLSFWCFYIFYKMLNTHNRFFQYLSKASYSIYLFHHLFIIVYGIILINTNFNIYVKFCLIVILTLITTAAIHHFFILKFSTLEYLFNGKKHHRQSIKSQ